MAFTGTAVVVMVSERKARITGLSLAAAAAGTIGLTGNSGTPGVVLPPDFAPIPYRQASDGAIISLQDSIQVSYVPDASVATAIPVECVKTGTDAADFVATLTNNHASTTSPRLEIYVEWH